jgi:hypothetical protein
MRPPTRAVGQRPRVPKTAGRTFASNGFRGRADTRPRMAPVCGPYEEQRVRRKPQEPLAPLLELRDMP